MTDEEQKAIENEYKDLVVKLVNSTGVMTVYSLHQKLRDTTASWYVNKHNLARKLIDDLNTEERLFIVTFVAEGMDDSEKRLLVSKEIQFTNVPKSLYYPK